MPPIEPSHTRKDFNCPHCGAHSGQTWYGLFASECELPNVLTAQEAQEYIKKNPGAYSFTAAITRKVNPEVELSGIPPTDSDKEVLKLHLTQCFSCKRLGVWVHTRMVWPVYSRTISPNSDLSPDIVSDFNEAQSILALSPRGAAALLRLCVQKLCRQLGEKGENLNQDIASFVRKGLDPEIQKMLDFVRVIGNEAVHPGTLDLRDDLRTATTLFHLVNSIANRMITFPSEIKTLYDNLPEDKKIAIEIRDRPKR